MSNVKIESIPLNERYVNIIIDKCPKMDNMTDNLKLIYELINDNSTGYGREYGKAYRAILKKARRLAGKRKYIISKKQVASLIRSYSDGDCVSVKIPYASDYIFRAIFDIFDLLKADSNVIIPSEIVSLYGENRRESFYDVQSSQYEYKFTHNLLNERDELTSIRKELVNDLCTEKCSLGKRV
jgi:hypothetical protein